MKVINLFGGPGVGKSTTAAGLFFLMKLKGYSVELVTEYAKDLVWSHREKTFTDQLYILAKQNHRLHVLKDEVDYVITDSPLLLSNVYRSEDSTKEWTAYVKRLFGSYNNRNFIINRVKEYVTGGRNENEEESDVIQTKIINTLVGWGYRIVDGDYKAPARILELIEQRWK